MAFATGVAKQLKYKAESTWGTVPAASASQALRRVSSNLSLVKDSYESNEINTTYQTNDMRHGVRRVEGSINGEVSPGTYKDFIAAACRRAFAAVTAATGVGVTIAGSGPTYTVTRSAGSYLTDGFKIGQTIRLTVGALNAANISKNLLIVALTGTVATVLPVNGVAMVAEGPITGTTVTVIGKTTFVPATGHLDNSFSVEHWHSDINQSEVFSGLKVSQLQVDLPPTGMTTLDIQFMGKDLTTATSEYFTSPTAATTSGVLAAVNGIFYAGSTRQTALTGLQFTINGNMSAEPVVGSNTYPDIFEGRVTVTGQFTAFFEDATQRDAFINETETSLFGVFTTGSSATADFLGVAMPRVKYSSASKDDGDKGLVQTFQFTALYNSAGGAGVSSEQSVIAFQDSLA